ncbi:hypothetical protein SCP_0210490 [Sparassis crispa]|uniref:Uncharacterized protein n=1 Tax=Sparassis crispa TaxID=139825 RepID=A0A401GCD7_9APHY|nr:hypothetical protein SCP_0210490 [Sparassis crispa]GBE79848.1 hypothetical protein SCP_0210490 [Sparassis crispa]
MAMRIVHIPANAFKSVITYCTPEARDLIYHTAVERFPTATSNTDPYNLEQRPPRSNEPTPANIGFGFTEPVSDHPFRSMRYLKKFVLESMAENREVHKVIIRRGSGGVDENGQKMDTVTGRHGLRLLIPTQNFPKKDVWAWRLLSEEERAMLEDTQAVENEPKVVLHPRHDDARARY